MRSKTFVAAECLHRRAHLLDRLRQRTRQERSHNDCAENSDHAGNERAQNAKRARSDKHQRDHSDGQARRERHQSPLPAQVPLLRHNRSVFKTGG
jgi:hypothetical protein